MPYDNPELPHRYDAFVQSGMSEATVKNIHWGIQREHGLKIAEFYAWYQELQGMDTEAVELHLAKNDAPQEMRYPFTQYTNINFFWLSMSPSGGQISPILRELFCQNFGSVDGFFRTFRGEAARCVTPDWVWLVYDKSNGLKVIISQHLRSPMTDPSVLPLLCCSLAEHCYLLDYGTHRDAYVVNWLNRIANYDYALARMGIRP